MSTANIVALIGVIAGVPAATYYPFMFLKLRWWESWIGRSMLTKGIALMLVFWAAILSVLAYELDWDIWVDWVSAVVDWWLVAAVWFQVIVMRMIQRNGEADDRMRDATTNKSGEKDV